MRSTQPGKLKKRMGGEESERRMCFRRARLILLCPVGTTGTRREEYSTAVVYAKSLGERWWGTERISNSSLRRNQTSSGEGENVGRVKLCALYRRGGNSRKLQKYPEAVPRARRIDSEKHQADER